MAQQRLGRGAPQYCSMGTMTEMPSSVRTIVPVTLRVLSVSCLVLYVRLRDVSARSGGPGSAWPACSRVRG
jgi:hypothetical protein